MFDRHRQPWQCSIITDCRGELSWFCQLVVPTVWWLLWNCRLKIKVLDIIPLGGGGVVRGGGGLWSQMTSA